MGRSEKKQLVNAIKEARLSGFHWAAAQILWSVNGIENALEYVRTVKERVHSVQLELFNRKDTGK